MNVEKKRQILKRIADLQADIGELKRARQELLVSGYASATMSSGGGSKSYTHLDASKLTEAIAQMIGELKSLRAMLSGTSKMQPTEIYTYTI